MNNQPAHSDTVTFTAPTTPSKAFFESREFATGISAIVENIKTQAAVFLDSINEISTTNPEAARLVSIAKTNLEQTVMWAVKAASRVNQSTNM